MAHNHKKVLRLMTNKGVQTFCVTSFLLAKKISWLCESETSNSTSLINENFIQHMSKNNNGMYHLGFIMS